MSPRSTREDAAAELLAAAGIDAGVTVAGQNGEIAAVRAAADRLADVAAHAAAIRALGFRYVAIEIGPEAARESVRD